MTSESPRIASRALWIGACLGLVGLVAAIYARTAGHGFVSFDDPGYIRRNLAIRDGLDMDGVRWAFGTFRMANWHPLTWISHMLDVELWGMDAGGHHLGSVVLHTLNAVLLLVALARITGAFWCSALVAALFAVHPLRVESVAWVSERKDVLAGTFFMLVVLAHARYAERPGAARAALVWLLAALGLMAKPMLVTLPFVLLLLDAWPLGRWDRLARASAIRGTETRPTPRPLSRLLLEKVPLLILSAASVMITVAAQRSLGAVSSLASLPLGERLANVPLAYLGYLRKAVLPTDLAFYYPHAGGASGTGAGVAIGAALGATALLLVVTVVAVRAARRNDGHAAWFAVGWFWFLGMLVPVIGLVQVGGQALADRYAYLPLIGLTLPLAWGLRALAARGPSARWIATGLGAAMVLACVPRAWDQVGTWRNNTTLYGHALAVTEDNHLAHGNLGLALLNQGRLDDAAGHLEQAVTIAPTFDKAHVGLGNVYLLQGRLDQAAVHLERALALRPDTFDAAHLLGRLRGEQGDLDAAVTWLTRAIAADPTSAEAHNDLGLVYGRLARHQDALREFQRALQLRPGLPEARANLAVVRKQLRD